ncbi:hypothetical protein GXY_02276 [Novacetimonas hansenii ATCC 23769]|uniref:Uncharacterized protein n=1 Tax=Novacetimonas hansenii ATCC 23769 TaxID=714995 RepID=D5QBG2_NOVHA|nr:hypothetical protein GXY_02276 [Novacetimonas hansenii ATCC 23769]
MWELAEIYEISVKPFPAGIKVQVMVLTPGQPLRASWAFLITN